MNTTVFEENDVFEENFREPVGFLWGKKRKTAERAKQHLAGVVFVAGSRLQRRAQHPSPALDPCAMDRQETFYTTEAHFVNS